MAEEAARWKQYEYASNSNLVLTAERRTRENEPSGEAETLANKKLFKMGDKAPPRSWGSLATSTPEQPLDCQEAEPPKQPPPEAGASTHAPAQVHGSHRARTAIPAGSVSLINPQSAGNAVGAPIDGRDLCTRDFPGPRAGPSRADAPR